MIGNTATTIATATEQERGITVEYLTGTDPIFVTATPAEATALRDVGFATRAVSIAEYLDGTLVTAKICELWRAGAQLAPLILIGDYADKVATARHGDAETKRGWGDNHAIMWALAATLKEAGMAPGIEYFLHGDNITQSDDYDILYGGGKTDTYNSIIDAVNDGDAGRRQLEDGINHAASRAQKLQRQGRVAAEQKRENELYEIQQTSAYANFKTLRAEIAGSANTPPISTGFPQFDDALGGGLRTGLYTIGAIPSLGKTTFALQIADQIAAAGQPVLIFHLEQGRTELMAKSISRYTATIAQRNGYNPFTKKEMEQSANRKYTGARPLCELGISDGRRYESYGDAAADNSRHALIEQAYREYAVAARNIYIDEGENDEANAEYISVTVDRYVNALDTAPVVIVDYLQIIKPYEKMDDRQSINETVKKLRRIARKNKTPVIVISSFNRTNYAAPVNMTSFKESGGIEYSSDVLMALQLDGIAEAFAEIADNNKAGERMAKIDDLKMMRPRPIELKFLKNRKGAPSAGISFEYVPEYNLFREKT
jgi:replicative DNA helicase